MVRKLFPEESKGNRVNKGDIVSKATTDLKAPILLIATTEGHQILKVAFTAYKEKTGLQNMLELIAKAPKTFFCKTYRIERSEFDQLSDEKFQRKLDIHFDNAYNNSYQDKIKAVYMSPTDKVSVSDIQSYVQYLISIIDDSPTYASAIGGGATPKVLNDLFIDGFKP